MTVESVYNLGKVDNFNYLGVTKTSKDKKVEIQQRIKCMGGLVLMLQSKSISQNVKKEFRKG